jgi:hypothetical protein
MKWHRVVLTVFMAVVVGHWAEHLVQIGQIYLLHWPKAKALGLLGIPFPWLVASEWLHMVYAALMLVGLVELRFGFAGEALSWWTAALYLQYWHGFEHLLLFTQVQANFRLVHWAAITHVPSIVPPQSIVQLLLPAGFRPELHLFYNLIVTIPMVIAFVHYCRGGASCSLSR